MNKGTKVKEITCILAIDDSKDFTTAMISYHTKDEKLVVLGEFRDYNTVDKIIIEELRKEIDE
jgi:hypothetical protein